MRWVITATVDPTKLDGVVMGRFGASVMDVGYSNVLRQWFWVWGGGQEMISEPPMIFVDEEWARQNRNLKPLRVEKSFAIRRKKAEQLMLF